MWEETSFSETRSKVLGKMSAKSSSIDWMKLFYAIPWEQDCPQMAQLLQSASEQTYMAHLQP